MSIRKNTWNLDGHYDLTNSGLNDYQPYAPIPDNNEFYAIGRNDAGALGQNNNTRYSSPTQIPGTQWKYIATGSQHSASIRNDSTLWTFGTNSSGRLGQNDTVQYSSPRQVPGTQWARIYAGRFDGLFATKPDNTLWAWGVNNSGTLGQNNVVPYSSPRQVPGTQWSLENISVGDQGVAALKTDGTLWAWGRNNEGELGQNDKIHRSSPVQTPGTQWSLVTIGTAVHAIKSDGTLWAMGNNTQGELGQNNRTSYSSPVQVPGTEWNSISTNDNHVVASKTDGTLWAWGNNGDGQLGQNNTTRYSSPVQLPGTQWNIDPKIASLYTTYRSTVTLKQDGTVWVWGSNTYGQLGLNNNVHSSSPTQIPGTNWSVVSGGPHILLLKQA